jgi:hypothetical protein
VRTLVKDEAWVHYGQTYVRSGDDFAELEECFTGQANGLCGAAVPGHLFMITGLHTGHVGFTVELHDEPPPVDDSWQEVVEVSFRPDGEAGLDCFGGERYWPLDLTEVSYRVRYCATGMDEGRKLDTRVIEDEDPEDGESLAVDHYLLQFWPAPSEPDTVLRQTSEIAAYWHGWVREQA